MWWPSYRSAGSQGRVALEVYSYVWNWKKNDNKSLLLTGNNPTIAIQGNPQTLMQSVVWRHLGSVRHNFPRAIAAFRRRAVLSASAAAWRSNSDTISVPSRLLAVPSNSKQWAKQRAAFPVTISSLLEPSKRRKTDSSVLRNRWTKNKKENNTLKYTWYTHITWKNYW